MKFTWANICERGILVSNFSVTRNGFREFYTFWTFFSRIFTWRDVPPENCTLRILLCAFREVDFGFGRLYILEYSTQMLWNSSIKQTELLPPFFFGFFVGLTVNLFVFEHAFVTEFASRFRFAILTCERMPTIIWRVRTVSFETMSARFLKSPSWKFTNSRKLPFRSFLSVSETWFLGCSTIAILRISSFSMRRRIPKWELPCKPRCKYCNFLRISFQFIRSWSKSSCVQNHGLALCRCKTSWISKEKCWRFIRCK